jgi:hypothetical protein
MSQRIVQAHRSCLRRYLGLRVNLFRAMHDARFFLSDDNTVVAARHGDFAIAACVAYDESMAYYYLQDCSWYRSDLTRVDDEDVPDPVRDELLRQFLSVVS